MLPPPRGVLWEPMATSNPSTLSAILLPCLLSAYALLASGCDTNPGPPKRVEVYHDFGMLELGESKTHDFPIPLPQRIKGGILIPSGYSGNCSCAVGMLMIKKPDGRTSPIWGRRDEDLHLVDGDEVILRLTLKTKDKEAVDLARDEELGNVTFKHIHGKFQRFTSQRVRFHFGIRTPIKATPVAHIEFGELPMSNPPYERSIELRSNIEGQTLTLKNPRTIPKCVAAELLKTDYGYRLKITVTPYKDSVSSPKIGGGVSMETGLENYPHLWIPVTGSFIGDIQFHPSFRIGFNIFPFNEVRERMLAITDHDRRRPAGFVVHSFLDLNGNDISKHFQIRFQKLAERRTRVYVKFLGTMGGKHLNGWLSLSKKAGDEPVAKIRINAFNALSR